MRSRRIRMSEREFELLPRELGWRYEYADGWAEIRPRHLAVKLTAPVTPRSIPDVGCRIRAVTPADRRALVTAFCDGFGDTVEYCDRTRPQIRFAAEDAVATFFAGKRGSFHPASRVAVPFDNPRTIAGAALVVQKPCGPFLDMLFIRTRRRQHGLGTALVGTVMNALLIEGAAHFGSAYNVANHPSIAWHHKFGFAEVPDLFITRSRAQLARHELWRRQQIGDFNSGERQELEREIARLDQLADRLSQSAGPRRPEGGARQGSSAA